MEPLETINNRLKDQYGRFDTTRPNWRIVWSTDQMEMRFGEYNRYSKSGLFLGTYTGSLLVPKYSYAKDRWILERLIPVTALHDIAELAGNIASYEPVWVFETATGEPLPYRWDAIKIIIESVHDAARLIRGGRKDKNPMDDPKISREVQEMKIRALEESLFGNESEIADALAYREGIIVPSSYRKDEVK